MNYDIRKDFFGRDKLIETANGEENFAQRIDREINEILLTQNADGMKAASNLQTPSTFEQVLKRGVPENVGLTSKGMSESTKEGNYKKSIEVANPNDEQLLE